MSQPMTHKLKIWPEHFDMVRAGLKKAEIRKNDRYFRLGDHVVLEEYDPETGTCTGEWIDYGWINYILEGKDLGLQDGFVMFSTTYVPASEQQQEQQEEQMPTFRAGQSRILKTHRERPNMKNPFIGKYCIVRTYSAGVFAGVVVQADDKEVVVENARRLWYWAGAASLSELANLGVSKPESCKFPAPVSSVFVTEVIEIIPVTDQAKKSIQEVPVWTAH